MSEETSQTNNEIPKNTENISNQIKTLEDQNQSTTDLEKQNLNPQPKILINQLDKPNKKNNPYLLKNKAILVSDLGSDFQDDEKNDSFYIDDDLQNEERVKNLNFKITNKFFKSNLNPIAQYNYFIEICNLSFNRTVKEEFQLIPINCFFSSLYDSYVVIIKKFKIVLFCLCKNACKYLMKAPKNKKKSEISDDITKPNKKSKLKILFSILYLLAAIILFVIMIYLFVYGLIILIIPHLFFTVYLLIGFIYHYKNKNLCEDDFISHMIYDDNFNDDQILVNFIILNNFQDLENYKICSFYEELKSKYKTRNVINIPTTQKFVIIGNRFKALPKGMMYYLIYQVSIAIIFSVAIFFINYFFGFY